MALITNQHIVKDKEITADKLYEYFTEVARNFHTKIPTTNSNCTDYLASPPTNSFVLNPTYPEEMYLLNISMKATHSSGPDHLDPSILSPNFSLIITPLTHVFKCSLDGIVPFLERGLCTVHVFVP